MHEHILVVEDNIPLSVSVVDVLQNLGYKVDLADDAKSGLEFFRQRSYALTILDLQLPDESAMNILKIMRESDPAALVVVMTAYSRIRTAIDCVKAGAYDYLSKPFEADDLKEIVRRALETRSLRLEVERLRSGARAATKLDLTVGTSPAFNSLVEVTRRIAAASRVPVLIRGEPGTGKERMARAIHHLSPRSAGPWMTINCAGLSGALFGSELFGFEKGAFSDARIPRHGLPELADGGTLLLYEIGNLSPALQAQVLRVIETQTFRRVGGQKVLRVDVRFVAATNRNLAAMVKAGTFREDLYFCLNGGSIEMPPLRARAGDIQPLARCFLDETARIMGIRSPELDRQSSELIEQYAWPGNVRELRNVMERALILSGGTTIQPTHLPKEINASGRRCPGTSTLEDEPLPLAEVAKRHIRQVMNACRGNKTRAAKMLGITRLTLRTRIAEYGWEESLDRSEVRASASRFAG